MPDRYQDQPAGSAFAKAQILFTLSLLLGTMLACIGHSGGTQAGSPPTLSVFAGVASGEGFADGPGI